ncbi:MAG: DNA-binding response regulator, partial [Deltaproteobacteria bacterium]
MIRILLADDHSIVRAGLRRIIEDSGDIEVIAEAADGHEAVQKAHESQPDVAVIDISMPIMDGLEVVSQLHHYYPKMPILILTMHEEEQYVFRAISAGARGYITKRSAPEQMVNAIRKVHAGGRYLSDSAAESLAHRLASGAQDRSPLDALSNREIQVLRQLALGRTTREIAEAYNISVKTVDTYRFR